MTHLFLEHEFEPPQTRDEVLAHVRETGWCYQMHRVQWNQSHLAVDGRRMFCWFNAPDVESLRLALRQSGSKVKRLWSGTVHQPPAGTDPAVPNVVVARAFEQPATFEELQQRENDAQACLSVHRVRFARTFFSLDRRRMFCLYQAPDAEAVRVAQRQAGMPVESVWAFEGIGPAAAQPAQP